MKLAVNESLKRTIVRAALYNAMTSVFAITLTTLWFGEFTKSITLNLIIIATAFVAKLIYERRWLRVTWGLKQ